MSDFYTLETKTEAVNNDHSRQADEFRKIVTTHHGFVCQRLLDNLSYTLESSCYDHDKKMWYNFAVLHEIKQMLNRYGYESLEEWNSHIELLDVVYISKAQADEMMEEQLDDVIEDVVLEEARNLHALFGMIVQCNIDEILAKRAFQKLKDINPDELRSQVRKLLTIEAKVQLKLNKVFSFEQWEDNLKKSQFG